MAPAWLGFASGVLAAAVSVFVALRQSRVNQRLERLRTELAAELHRREAQIDRQLVAEDVLARYREPLAVAAFDLQSRLYNILRLDFLGKFARDGARAEIAYRTTLFRIAQYFGWTEILRRDIQFLSFPAEEQTRRVATLQSDIAKVFLRHGYGDAMMIWGDEQRALGELMIVEEHGKVIAMGFAAFDRACDDAFAPWLARLRAELALPEATTRLRDVQHLLCTLVETLDLHRVRYADDLDRA